MKKCNFKLFSLLVLIACLFSACDSQEEAKASKSESIEITLQESTDLGKNETSFEESALSKEDESVNSSIDNNGEITSDENDVSKNNEPSSAESAALNEDESEDASTGEEEFSIECSEMETHVHNFGDWIITKDSTCTDKGEKERSCSCGEKEYDLITILPHKETIDKAIPATCKNTGLTEGKHCSVCDEIILAQKKIEIVSHSYENGACRWCGVLLYDGVFKELNISGVKSLYVSNEKVLAVSTEKGAAMFDINGNRISDYYDYIQSPSEEGYCVATNIKKEELKTEYCDIDEVMETFYRTIYYTYVLNSKGEVVYEAIGDMTEDFHDFFYTGEIIYDCRSGRIITVTWSKYLMGKAFNDCTLHIYDLKGNKICDIENVQSFGSYTKDKLLVSHGGFGTCIYDKQGKQIASEDSMYSGWNRLEFGSGIHTSFFVDGYITVLEDAWYPMKYLVSEDLKTVYTLKEEYYSGLNYGTLIFSKIKNNSEYSEEYYLIDVSKCKTDDEGVIIPSKDAAVCSTAFKNGYIHNWFGMEEKYFLVNTTDGKWGYVSTDGKVLKVYEEASSFDGGFAAVKDGDEIYIINENFERVSNGITSYDGVSCAGNGIFVLTKGDKEFVAVYSK